MKITVLDTETTGLDPNLHEIIQLGMMRIEIMDNGILSVLEEREINILPKHIETATKEALTINGYTQEAWSNGVPFEQVVPLINDFVTSSDMLLGQNLYFDLSFIAKACEDLHLPIPKFPKYIDTKFMGDVLVKEGVIKSSSMDRMCEHFKIKFKGRAHTALTDCQRTVTVWETLQKYTQERFFTFEDPYRPYANKPNTNTKKLITEANK